MKKGIKDKKAKEPKQITPHWQEMIAVYFDFCRTKFSSSPSFDGSAPRDLKCILTALQKRAENAGVEWSLKIASERLGKFLDAAYGDVWLKGHFLLLHLNRQKDIIFFKTKEEIQNARREESQRDISSDQPTGQKIKPSGSFGSL